jgi:phenylacetic acid degradation operon negative regulatory protein
LAEQGARPALSRRREIGRTSARSLLMTILGEYVLPRGEPVWTQVLIGALALFGIEEKSARQALARSGADGWIAAERVGRRVRWSLTPPGRRLLSEGTRRIYEFGREATDWGGQWLLLMVTVPESQRELRHRVRTQLNWAGFGSPAAGVWVSPHTSSQAAAASIVAEAGLEAQAMSFVAGYGEIGAEEAMVARSWDLASLEARYEAFIDEFTGLEVATEDSALRAQTRMVHAWRRFPFLDPQLPVQLLPASWSGLKAAEVFHANHAGWHAMAQGHWERLLERAG